MYCTIAILSTTVLSDRERPWPSLCTCIYVLLYQCNPLVRVCCRHSNYNQDKGSTALDCYESDFIDDESTSRCRRRKISSSKNYRIKTKQRPVVVCRSTPVITAVLKMKALCITIGTTCTYMYLVLYIFACTV